MLPVGLFDWHPEPRYNIAPTQKVAAVRATADAGGRDLVPLKWGLSGSVSSAGSKLQPNVPATGLAN